MAVGLPRVVSMCKPQGRLGVTNQGLDETAKGVRSVDLDVARHQLPALFPSPKPGSVTRIQTTASYY